MDRRTFLTGVVAASGLSRTSRSWGQPDTSGLATRPLGRAGLQVTVLGLGGFTGMKEPRSAAFDPVELAETALDAGIRYFDTAPGYGDGQSERNYGVVLARRRNEVFLATKTDQRTYDGVMRQFENSLKQLCTDHVDLLQIHGARADEDLASWGKPDGVVRALERLRDQKAAHRIGVTGHESPAVMCQAISLYDFDTVLTTFNPTERRKPYIEQVLPLAQEKGMGILAMKVMGGWWGSLALGNPLKNDGKPNHDDAPQQAAAGDLIRYVLGLPITVAVVGMSSLEQLRINVAAVRDGAPLDEPQRKQLEARLSQPADSAR